MVLGEVLPLIPDISDIENSIPMLGEEIRDSLELLTGEEKLDKSAIHGLEDYEEVSRLSKIPRTGIGGGSTARNFYQLFDVPQSYSGQTGKALRVKTTEDGLEFYTDSPNIKIASFGITIDGGGSAITTGVKGFISIPYDCTINSWDIYADQSGSCVIDVWKDTYANFPPTVADTIAGTEKPTLSSAQKNQDTNLTTWTTAISAGDVIAFNVDSAATVTRINLIIKVTKT